MIGENGTALTAVDIGTNFGYILHVLDHAISFGLYVCKYGKGKG